MVQILLELQAGAGWDRALSHVPRRGLLTPEQRQAQAEQEQERMRGMQAAAEKRRNRWERASAAAVALAGDGGERQDRGGTARRERTPR